MKKLLCSLLLMTSFSAYAWQTWVYNETGHDIMVKLYGIGSFAGLGDFEVLIPKDTSDKIVIDTGIYGISHGSISIMPSKALEGSCLEEGHDEYCDAVLKFLNIDFENPCYNQLPGMTIRVSLVNVFEGSMRRDAWLKGYIEGYDGSKVVVASKKLSEVLP
jgi:hypothetical protein